MNKLSGSRSGRLFLIELILAVLFFSLGSAVCVQAFVKAHSASTQAQDLAFASSTVSSAANALRWSGGAETFLTLFPEARQDADGVYFACYGAGLQPCGEEEAAYLLRIETGREEYAASADIGMYSAGGELLYELTLRWPAPEA